MNFKKIILTSVLTLGALCGYAQQSGEVTQYVFNPHWYGQLQVGGQETLGEGSFGKLLSPNAQIAVGYQINPLFGLRLGAGGWLSKGAMTYPQGAETEYWKYNYVAPALDLTFNLTNAFGGYNPTRLVDFNLFAGLGANIAWGNDEAIAYNASHTIATQPTPTGVLRNIWDGTKVLFLGRFGAGLDFRLSDAVKLGVELNANILSDKYNSKKAGNADWYFNGLVGIKYNFGAAYTKKVVEPVVPVVPVVETVVVRDTVYVQQPPTVVTETFVETVTPVAPVAPVPETLTRNVFYKINSYTISAAEMTKVAEIAEYMKAHPESTVQITGYADKGTGTLAINVRLARQRAQAVVNALTKKYGIAANRISWTSMTDHEFQPFPEDPVKNRVAICICE